MVFKEWILCKWCRTVQVKWIKSKNASKFNKNARRALAGIEHGMPRGQCVNHIPSTNWEVINDIDFST